MSSQLPPSNNPYQQPPQYSPYQAPAFKQPNFDPDKRPACVVWMMVYCALLTLMYTALIPLGLFLMSADPSEFDDPSEPIVLGTLLAVVSVPFLIASALPFVLPRKKWVWVYHLVLICLGLTSACTMLPSIGLLIFYLKPETKAYFGY